jgi:Ni/Fe-hydrogenase subunit HybB-like protein
MNSAMLATPVSDSVDRVPSSWAAEAEVDLLRTLGPMEWLGRLWVAGLAVVVAIGMVAYALQLVFGLSVTAMNDYVSWGLYMANFVFFIGISYAGTLISAVLRLTHAEWRRPITRMAETITVVALMVGASMIVIDMGRPDRLFNVFTSGRIQSPILWDVASISTYFAGSLLYLYVAMVPDLAIVARHGRARGWPRWVIRIYELGALGFRGTPAQHRRLDVALGVMAVIMIPVAISAHTVVSWIFGVTLRPGWHSTIFGPYFVVGAIFSGTAGIITAMAIFRRVYRLERYLRFEHFRRLAMLLLALTLLYSYFTLSEYLTIWYGGSSADARLLALLMGGTPYGVAFWAMVILGLAVPAVLLVVPTRRSVTPIVIASILINIGMWVKRYLIVVPTMQTPLIPAEAAGVPIDYFPTWVEWAVTAGGLACFLLLFTLFSRVVPIVSIWETVEAAPSQGGHPPAPEASRADSRQPGRLAPGTVACVPILLVTGLSLAAAAPIEAAQEPQPVPVVEIARQLEYGEEMLTAAVTLEGRPLAGVRVAFFVRRLFGLMPLGEDTTLDDGTAAIAFPTGLPGGESGDLDIVAEIRAPSEYAEVRGAALVRADVARETSAAPVPRALWSSRPPLPIVFTVAALLALVWGTYAFVVMQLAGIRREASQPESRST